MRGHLGHLQYTACFCVLCRTENTHGILANGSHSICLTCLPFGLQWERLGQLLGQLQYTLHARKLPCMHLSCMLGSARSLWLGCIATNWKFANPQSSLFLGQMNQTFHIEELSLINLVTYSTCWLSIQSALWPDKGDQAESIWLYLAIRGHLGRPWDWKASSVSLLLFSLAKLPSLGISVTHAYWPENCKKTANKYSCITSGSYVSRWTAAYLFTSSSPASSTINMCSFQWQIFNSVAS